MSAAMTNYFVVEPPIDPHDTFRNLTYDLVVAFHEELERTTGGRPLSNAIVMAAGVLKNRHGEHAAWELFELGEFLREAEDEAPELLPHFGRFKSTLVAFLAFLARRQIVSREAATRAELSASMAERPRRPVRRDRETFWPVGDPDDWEVVIAPRETVTEADDTDLSSGTADR